MPLPLPAVASKRARSTFFLFRVPTLVSAGRFPFLLAARRAAPAYEHTRTRSALHHARARARTRALARTRTNGRRRTTRRAVRRRAWLTGSLHEGGGDTERTLTAEAGPSHRDPYRHALTRRPPRKARPFCFLNYSETVVMGSLHPGSVSKEVPPAG